MEVHNLNPTAARVWELCDGGTTPQQIAAQLHGDLTPAQAEELVWLSLKRLEKANLLAADVVKPAGRAILTRREMLKGLGVAAVMLPVVTSIVAPGPVEAQSGGGGGTCSIVRTLTAVTVLDSGTSQYFAFNEGAITDADFAACTITQLTLAWDSGNSSPGIMTRMHLCGTGGTPEALQFTVNSSDPSPVLITNSGVWTGNRPYAGINAEKSSGTGDFIMGNVTITLS